MSPSQLPRDSYHWEGWTLSFRRVEAAPGHESKPPLLLIHPVGIGLASWFWDKFVESWEGAELFIPDLIGCGDGDVWIPEERGLFLPLDWVRACEALWRQSIRRPCIVVVQGGLAPVGVRMCARENDEWQGGRAVCGLVLTSPPTWDDMVNPALESKVQDNYERLSSRLGQRAFDILENRFFIRFFSNLFLFGKGRKADDRWLDLCCQGVRDC